MSQTVVLRVTMSCSGCSGAVQRALAKAEGIESFEVDLKEQKVTVKTDLPPEAVFETVSKTGKKTSYWEEPQPQPEAPASTETAPAPAPETASTETVSTPAAAETAPALAPETAPAETTSAPAPVEPVIAA